LEFLSKITFLSLKIISELSKLFVLKSKNLLKYIVNKLLL
jgi:hypothetical protein